MVKEGERATTAAQEGVIEARKATREAERTADIQETAFRRLERPYLFIEITDIQRLKRVVMGGKPSIRFRVVNYGKTPAILKWSFFWLGMSEIENRLLVIATDPKYEIIPAQGSLPERGLKVDGTHIGQLLTDDDRKALRLHVEFVYDDVTGATHRHQFTLNGNSTGSFYLARQNQDTEYHEEGDQYSPTDPGALAT